eukprot:gnl/Carplike_NY0171/4224_a5719_204.p1 GENE.gnl/Carplike_NY0171/4224_a5719_204~~gnl/Carplike_NY0171/4224_a5719_204.p1  ORF type:complete len:516 (+),score=146.62 gnl/Carplike_NY0171/4224_a5719_204:232-1548(+)
MYDPTAFLTLSEEEDLEAGSKAFRVAPSNLIHLFINRDWHLLRFLEFCKDALSPAENGPAVYSALLELYLERIQMYKHNLNTLTPESCPDVDHFRTQQLTLKKNIEEYKNASLSLISSLSSECLDVYHTVTLCRMYEFDDGCLRVYEKHAMHAETLRHFMKMNMPIHVIDSFKKHLAAAKTPADIDKSVCVQVLRFFVISRDKQFIYEILKLFTKHNVAQPLEILRLLCRLDVGEENREGKDKGKGKGETSGTAQGLIEGEKDEKGAETTGDKMKVTKRAKRSAPFGLLKDYFVDVVTSLSTKIDELKGEIGELESSVFSKEKEIDSLKTRPKNFSASMCSMCGDRLSLPVVHFFCGHSFHKRCAPLDGKCVICEDKFRTAAKLKRELSMRVRGEEEVSGEFFERLVYEKSFCDRESGFAAVGDFFASLPFADIPPEE